MVDQEVEEWHTHQAYLGEGPRAAEMVYKRISQAREQDARKKKEKENPAEREKLEDDYRLSFFRYRAGFTAGPDI
jgi:hypothetical protein